MPSTKAKRTPVEPEFRGNYLLHETGHPVSLRILARRKRYQHGPHLLRIEPTGTCKRRRELCVRTPTDSTNASAISEITNAFRYTFIYPPRPMPKGNWLRRN